jgi:hypothetical protein
MCESFPECLGPCDGGPVECTCLFLPPRPRPSPVHYRGRLPAFPRPNDFITDCLFVPTAAAHRLRAAKAFTSELNMLRCLRMHRIC